MVIWKHEVSLNTVNRWAQATLIETLGICVTAIGDDYLRGTMPVDHRTRQPYGILHGGASVALAETLGSLAAGLCCPEGTAAVGLDINANHLRSCTSGLVTGTARPVHLGRSTHVWEIRIDNEAAQLVCIARLTMAVAPREKLPIARDLPR